MLNNGHDGASDGQVLHMYACYCRAVILYLTFHQSPTEVGAGAISDGLHEQLCLIFVCLSHASEAKL